MQAERPEDKPAEWELPVAHKIHMKGRPHCMGGKGLWKGAVMRIQLIQLLPEDLVVATEMSKQNCCRLLPVLPALAADDSEETTSQDSDHDTVNIKAQHKSRFCPELSAFAVKIVLAHRPLGRP